MSSSRDRNGRRKRKRKWRVVDDPQRTWQEIKLANSDAKLSDSGNQRKGRPVTKRQRQPVQVKRRERKPGDSPLGHLING